MRAFFEARIEHLSIHDRVRVECLGKLPSGERCNRIVLIAVQGLNLPGYLLVKEIPQATVLDLKTRVRCRECGAKGRAIVSVKWRREDR